MHDTEKRDILVNLRKNTIRLEREGDYWTPDDNETLTEMFRDGNGISEIAIHLQRSERAVCQQIEKLDLYRRSVFPQRRKSIQRPECLCKSCMLYESACPGREHCMKVREGENDGTDAE